MQVLSLGRVPRTKETLPDFREKSRVTRHSRVFRGLTGSQRTPGIGASQFTGTQIGIFSTRFKAFETEFTAKTSLRTFLTIYMALSRRIT